MDKDGNENKIEVGIKEEKEEVVLKERIEKTLKFLKKGNLWVIGLLIVALILGAYIRSLPMQDHGGQPGLWDITKNDWTLGPDLDPWLFERYAKDIVEEGKLPEVDTLRNVPLGFETSKETMLLPYMIAYTYKFYALFHPDINVEFAGAILPVIMFVLTILTFFLFVREVFITKDKKSHNKANLISIISTFFMIVSPVFLSRTIAGIPEKESSAFFFMFLALYLFLKAWKADKLRNKIILGLLSGAATALMGLIWGGVSYLFITIAAAAFLGFILNQIHKEEFLVYLSWMITSFGLLLLLTARVSLAGFITSLDTGLAFLVFAILVVHFLMWNTKISKMKILSKIKIPKNLISLIVTVILGIIVVSIFLGPGVIIGKINDFNQVLFRPVVGRWNTTVAENRQPYYVEWIGNFGPFIKNIPIFFVIFMLGSIFLFKKVLKNIEKKHAWILTGLYTLFLIAMVYSRYSPTSLFNGENLISKAFFYLVSLAFLGYLIYYDSMYKRKGSKGFEKIEFDYLILFVLFILTLLTARGLIRLVMVLGVISPIFAGYMIIESIYMFRSIKDETWKIITGILVIILLLASIFTFISFYTSVKSQAYNFVPSAYNFQWQKAMEWVRDSTPTDAVFAHWWDYGYWVQSIGERATVLDGGNAISFWNYYMGRLVLTGDNQDDALEFLYNHDANYLLIDSSDIGKYGAFSSIGSHGLTAPEYDRYSWIGTFLLSDQQSQETKNQTILVYTGGIALDEDLIINESGKQVLLPIQKAGVGAMIVPINKEDNGTTSFSQPSIIAVYQNQQYRVNMRYLSVAGQFYDFGEGIEACAYVFPLIQQQGQQIGQNPLGAAMFISPRLFRGMLSQIYILNDPLGRFPNFELAHTENSLIIDNLNQQGMSLPEFVYFQGVQGPIKIWEIEYTGNETIDQKYLDTDSSKYLNWTL